MTPELVRTFQISFLVAIGNLSVFFLPFLLKDTILEPLKLDISFT